MATKQEERKALEQIKKIVAGLGEESYIGRAFEGCFDMAASNIEDDFWDSMKERAERYNVLSIERLQEVEEAEKRAKTAEAEVQYIDGQLKLAQERAVENGNAYREKCDKVDELTKQVSALELENIKLKAKLYDLMTA